MICEKCGHIHNEMVYEETQIDSNIVIETVLEYFKLYKKDVLQKTHKRTIVLPRQIIHYMLRKFTMLPFKFIGELFKQDHSTVINSCNVIKDLYQTDEDVKDAINIINYILSDKLKKLYAAKKLSGRHIGESNHVAA